MLKSCGSNEQRLHSYTNGPAAADMHILKNVTTELLGLLYVCLFLTLVVCADTEDNMEEAEERLIFYSVTLHRFAFCDPDKTFQLQNFSSL